MSGEAENPIGHRKSKSLAADGSTLRIYEGLALNKYPVKGKCANSCFKNGWHRCGTVPVLSVLDGGSPGDSARVICLECGERMKDDEGDEMRYFIPRPGQPREIRV